DPPTRGPCPPKNPPLPFAEGAPVWTRDAAGRLWWLEDRLLSVQEDGIWRTFPTPTPDAAYPPRLLVADSEGTVWIGSDRGLVQARPSAVGALVPPGTLSDINVYALTQDAQGRVW